MPRVCRRKDEGIHDDDGVVNGDPNQCSGREAGTNAPKNTLPDLVSSLHFLTVVCAAFQADFHLKKFSPANITFLLVPPTPGRKDHRRRAAMIDCTRHMGLRKGSKFAFHPNHLSIRNIQTSRRCVDILSVRYTM